MQSPRALGRLLGDVERNLCLIDIGMSFDQIVDGAHYIGRFDDEQRLAHAHGVACACAYLQHSARVRRKDRGQTILVEGNFSGRFKIEIDSLLPDGFDTNLFQLFRRGLNHTRREYAVRLCRSWFLVGRLAQKQKDCAHYGNDPGSKPESSSPFRGWLDIFSIARCQVIHRSEEHTSELQSPYDIVCRLLLEKKNNQRFAYRFSRIGDDQVRIEIPLKPHAAALRAGSLAAIDRKEPRVERFIADTAWEPE